MPAGLAPASTQQSLQGYAAGCSRSRPPRCPSRRAAALHHPLRIAAGPQPRALVRPELVAEVKYLTWTGDNLLRQVVYEGLREDKPAAEVRREVPYSKL
jgi:ATP-dependent DNA ligase